MYFTTEMCRQKLEMWLKAEEAIALSQEIMVDGERITRANLDHVRKMVDIWEKRYNESLAGSSNFIQGIARW